MMNISDDIATGFIVKYYNHDPIFAVQISVQLKLKLRPKITFGLLHVHLKKKCLGIQKILIFEAYDNKTLKNY